jgi:hypothetical protein
MQPRAFRTVAEQTILRVRGAVRARRYGGAMPRRDLPMWPSRPRLGLAMWPSRPRLGLAAAITGRAGGIRSALAWTARAEVRHGAFGPRGAIKRRLAATHWRHRVPWEWALGGVNRHPTGSDVLAVGPGGITPGAGRRPGLFNNPGAAWIRRGRPWRRRVGRSAGRCTERKPISHQTARSAWVVHGRRAGERQWSAFPGRSAMEGEG